MRFVFWNVGRRGNPKLVAEVVRVHRADVLILAESNFDQELSAELNATGEDVYWFANVIQQARLRVHTRLPRGTIRQLGEKNWLSAFRVTPEVGQEFLLVGAHFASKYHLRPDSQAALSTRLRLSIDMWESEVGHNRTILTGDLNMNPFENGVVGSESLFAVMTRADARPRVRRVRGERRHLFYNPMWRLLAGQRDAPGTYRDNGSDPHSTLWNIFDQVIVRPDLLDYFDDESLKIITRAGGSSLAKPSGWPHKSAASDHFPILFELFPERTVMNG